MPSAWKPFHESDFSFKNPVDIFDYIVHRTTVFGESWDIKIVSRKGLGKSTVALAVGKRCDKNFTVAKNVSLTAQQWLLKSASLGRGAALIMDEIGTKRFASSHKWHSEENQDFSDDMQLNRTDGQIYIATTLDDMRITNRVRDTFPVYIYPERKITVRKKVTNPETGKIEIKKYLAIRCIVRIAKSDLFNQNSGKDFWSYPRYCDGGVIKRVILYHPPEDVFEEYMTLRNELKNKLRESFVARQKARLALEEGRAGVPGRRRGDDEKAVQRVNGGIRERILRKDVEKSGK